MCVTNQTKWPLSFWGGQGPLQESIESCRPLSRKHAHHPERCRFLESQEKVDGTGDGVTTLCPRKRGALSLSSR